MSIILSIDTALPLASVGLAHNGNLLTERISEMQKEHAAFLHPAIESMLKESNISINELDAVSVTIGPGSYTGLRVGLASAKGLCFALKKPLIALCTLETMAFQTRLNHPSASQEMFFCPMIDARRMEVFTALYGSDLSCFLKPHAHVLDEHSFQDVLKENQVVFSGNGSDKFLEILNHPNARKINVSSLSSAMAQLSFTHYNAKVFAETKSLEPNYLKAYQA
jgi:tRNA threonylcarbamoyladenosine biosynthesis protein TsaB